MRISCRELNMLQVIYVIKAVSGKWGADWSPARSGIVANGEQRRPGWVTERGIPIPIKQICTKLMGIC